MADPETRLAQWAEGRTNTPPRRGECAVILGRLAALERWQREAVSILTGTRNYDVIQRLLREAGAQEVGAK